MGERVVETSVPGYRHVGVVHRGRHRLWRVERESDGRRLILKLGGRPELRAALRREHALLAPLDVPGVVRAVALEELGDLTALVLEDAGPDTLAAWLRRHGRLLDPGRFLALAAPLARTVAGLHARSLIHGNIGPINLVVDEAGERLTLIDFGAAIDTAAVARRAGPDRLEGALEYMAPEQSGRLNRVVDHRADLYSLGVTFYEMLCGVVPFSSADPLELVYAHLARAPVPPASVHASVPPLLSDLVSRLLQKMPEERYQSAATLADDLEEAARRWRAEGAIAPFVLGRADTARALPARAAFCGRRAELELVAGGFERVAAGGCEVVLVRGAAGIGKSALLDQAAAAIGERGVFLRGKCDAMRREVPYAPLAQAFGDFVQAAAAAPDGSRELQRRLDEQVGKNLPVLASALPALAAFAGDEPVPSLGPVEAERRFQLTFASLVRAVRGDRPLVLVLDDLQWADAATLRLVGHLAADAGSRQLLVLGAFRGDEAGADHRLARAIAALRASPTPLQILELAALDRDEVTALCADLLRAPAERVAPLAAYAHRKAAGNAFSVQQLLRSLVAGGQLAFDVAEGGWRWDMAEVARVSGASAMEHLGKLLRGLPRRTRRSVQTAACFSQRIDVPLLAQILEQPVDVTAADLWPAIEADLLIPASAASAWSVSYQFLHDRVHQAARELLSDAERQRVHLQIGTALLGDEPAAALGDRLFDAVDQLDLGAAMVTESPRRVAIAELNLQAAEMARARAAYGPALAYSRRGIELLPAADDEAPHELRFRLHRDAAECAYLSGQLAAADELARCAFDLTRTPLEKAEIYNIRISACASHGDHERAIALGREALALFDLALPPGDAPDQLGDAAFAAVREQLGARPPQELLGLPRMSDPTTLARMEILANLLSPTFVSDQRLFAAVTARMVSLSLTHGNSVYSAFSYAAYGMLLIALEGDRERGHACGRLGVELARRFGDPVQECRTIHVFCCFVNHWRAPLASSLPLIRTGIERGIEAGELQYATLAQVTHVVCLYHLGIELSQVMLELGAALPLAHGSQQKAAHDYELCYRQAVRCLQGTTAEPGRFDDDDFREADYLEAAADNPVALALYFILRLEASYLLGNLEEARALSDRAKPVLFALEVLFPVVEHVLYSALVAAAEARCDPQRRGEAIDELAARQLQLAQWARDSPDNVRAKERVVAAELARLRGELDEAAALYDEAIDAARHAGMLKDEALASELCGRFWQERGRERIARMYLREAVIAYQRWGALAKVAALEEESSGAATESSWTTSHLAVQASAVDLLGLLKAAGRICAEVAIDRLVERLLAACFELAGATRGGLITAEDGELTVLALGSTAEPVTLVRRPLADSRDLPVATIRRAWEAETQLVAADAARHRRFSSDPYFARHKIRSVLVMPIRRQATATGILYLENRLAADVFSPDRVSLMRLLSSQIAISLENSSLFEKLRVESEENARLYQEAQQSIRLRDEFLSVASHELRTPIASLQLAVQGLQTSLRRSPETFPQVLGIASRQVQRLSSLVDELLTVSRIQEGCLELTLADTDLVALVEQVVERFAFQAAQAGCAVRLRHGGPLVGRWDRGRLDQVVTNLLSNALKFGPGKPIEIELERRGEHARLRMTDYGIGIAPERAPRIFERFERAVPASRYGGLGLGLYISQQIAEALGGSIAVDSELGAGATFTLDVPVVPPARGTWRGDQDGDGDGVG